VLRPLYAYIGTRSASRRPIWQTYPEIITAGNVWVAEIAGQVVGVRFNMRRKLGFYIDTVAAIPELQGAGVAGRYCFLPKTKQSGAASIPSTYAPTSR